MKAEASHAARVRSELKADQESYRANLRKVFDRELAVAGREAAIAKAEAGLMAQRSELETRCQGLEIHKQELDKLSETLQGWREQL